MIDLLTVYPKDEIDLHRASEGNLLAAHENDVDAHGLNILRADISSNDAAVKAATSLLRASFKSVFTDTFDRSNSTGLNNGWMATFSGSPNIVSNAAAAVTPGTPGVVNGAYRNLAVVDQIISGEVSIGVTGEASFMLRLTNPQNYILVQVSTTVDLYFIIGAVYSAQTGVKATTIGPGATVTCEAIGSTLTVRVGDVTVWSGAIPGALAAGTNAGVRVSGASSLLAWRAQTLAGADVAAPVTVTANRAGQLAALLYTTTRVPVASDNFNRADGAVGTPVLGPAWNVSISEMPQIVGNKATLEAPKNDGAYQDIANGNRWSVRATLGGVTAGSAEAGVTVWVNGVTGWQMLQLRRLVTKISVRKFTGAVYEEVFFQTAVAQTTAERAEIIVLNDVAWFIYDGILIYTLILPSIPTSYKLPGFLVGYGATVDDWTLDKLVTT